MTILAKTGSALLALTMVVTVQATTVTSSLIGATALTVISSTDAHAGRAERELRKAERAERRAARQAYREYKRTGNIPYEGRPDLGSAEPMNPGEGGPSDGENGGVTGGSHQGQ